MIDPVIYKQIPDGTVSPATASRFTDEFRDDLETYEISNALFSINDLSHLSEEFEELAISSDPSLSFSPTKTQYLKELNLKGYSALEINADHGHVTRFLGENYEEVSSIKITRRSTAASLRRCSDLDNINLAYATTKEAILETEFHCAEFDLIFISDIERLNLDQEQMSAFLNLVTKSIKKDGLLILEAHNPNRASKWFAHGNMPFPELYEASNGHFSSSGWNQLLSNCKFEFLNQYVALPDLFESRSILECGYLDNAKHSLNHFYASSIVKDRRVNDYLLFKQLSENKINTTSGLSEFCNGYIFIASKNASICDSLGFDYLHFSGTSRKRRWRTATIKMQSSDAVVKKSLFESGGTSSCDESDRKISQNLSAGDHQEGQLLAGLWTKSALEQPEYLTQLIRDYYQWLLETLENNKASGTEFNYDLVPFNIVVKDNNEMVAFDKEWRIEGDNDVDYIFFRALFWFAYQNTSLLVPFANHHHLYSIADFINFHFNVISKVPDLEKFIKAESSVQCELARVCIKDEFEKALQLPICGYLDRFKLARTASVNLQFGQNLHDFEFIEEFSQNVKLESKLQTVTFKCLPSVGILNNTSVLRIQLADTDTDIALNRIRLYQDEKGSFATVEFESAKEINEAASLNNLVFQEHSNEEIGDLPYRFISTSTSPSIDFDLSTLGLAKIARVEIDIAYLSTWGQHSVKRELNEKIRIQQEKIVGLQMHSAEQQSVISKNSEKIDDLRTRLSKTNHELNVLKSSAKQTLFKRLKRRLFSK